MKEDQPFHDRLLALRREAGMTQDQVLRLLDQRGVHISLRTYQNYERGGTAPFSSKQAGIIIKALEEAAQLGPAALDKDLTLAERGICGRLFRAYSELGVNRDDFAEQVGLSVEELVATLEGKRFVQAHELSRVLMSYPETDIHWILTGEKASGAERSNVARDLHVCLDIIDVSAEAGSAGPIQKKVVGEYVIDKREVESLYQSSSRVPFVVEVDGDAMVPDLLPGERAIIEPIEESNIRVDALYLLRLEDLVVIRRLQRLPGRRILVSSSNQTYQPYEIDLTREPDFKVLGRVWGKFKRF